MEKHDIVVIGTSAGGLDPLKRLIGSLPDDFKASVFIVMHLNPLVPSNLPTILSRVAPVEVVPSVDGQEVKKRRIYVAPPDHHLLVENNTILVKKGPKENRFRP